jgi:hypothetical protein
VHAASAPNYAVLAVCPSAGTPIHGTYGAPSPSARETLSVQAGNLSSGTPTATVELIGYDSAGHEVASVKGEAKSGEWRLALVLSAEPRSATS